MLNVSFTTASVSTENDAGETDASLLVWFDEKKTT